MAERKLIEINVKNKEHRACCGAIQSLITDVEAMHKDLLDFQKELEKTTVSVNMKNTFEKKIADIGKEHKDLLQKADLCGCI